MVFRVTERIVIVNLHVTSDVIDPSYRRSWITRIAETSRSAAVAPLANGT